MKNILPILILLGVVALTVPSYSQLDSCYTTRAELDSMIFAWQTISDTTAGMHHIRVDSIGHSRGDQLGVQYPIYAVKFSDNVDEFEDEPTVLIIGHIHAEEVAGMEGVVKFMRHLLLRDGPSYRSIVSNAQVYVIPTINPDGLEVISSGIEIDSAGFPVRRWDDSWRKNGYRPPELPGDCNIFPGVGRDSCGVDLNRNFDLNWIHGDPLWWETAFEAYDYFRGPAPASEPETQAVMNFAEQIKPAISLVWHSSRTGNFSGQCFTAWDWGTTASLPKYPPDYEAINSVRGEAQHGFTSSTEIWPEGGYYTSVFGGTHNGCTQDWFYWKLGCIQIVTETSGANTQIQPPCAGGDQTSIYGLAGTLVAPNEWLCRRVFNGPGSVTPDDMDDQGAALAIYTKVDEPGFPAISAEWRILNTWTPLLPPWYTNEQHGRATFLPPPGDSLFIMARKEGFVSDTAMVGITPGAYQTQSVTLYLQPLPWHNLTIRVEDEAGTAIPAGVHLLSDFPTWLPVDGEATISKPRGNYTVEVIPEGSNKIAIWRHFSMDTDTSFTFVLPNGQERMNETFNDNDLSDWSSDGEGNRWGTDLDTTAQNYGNSLATNPAATYRPKYAANADTWIEYNNTISLDNDNAAHLAFSRRGRLEACEDSLLVEVRTDGSENWEVAKGYSDLELPWVRDWVNLTPWAGETIRLRFRLITDESLEELGLHIDNVSVVSGIDHGGSETPATVPFSYKITNAYPNPFNPSTTIAYEVAAPGLVTFAIFNLLGQEVWRSNESLPTAGAYTFRWDGISTSGAALSSGLYFVQMQTDVVHSTKKLLLLK